MRLNYEKRVLLFHYWDDELTGSGYGELTGREAQDDDFSCS